MVVVPSSMPTSAASGCPSRSMRAIAGSTDQSKASGSPSWSMDWCCTVTVLPSATV
jgi:hypothetical protein